MDHSIEIEAARVKFIAMAVSYCPGVFNDNCFQTGCNVDGGFPKRRAVIWSKAMDLWPC
jgi:hypothetical protein